MFSGIRSMIFGYSGADASDTSNESVSQQSNNSPATIKSSANDTTGSIGQTLNAATTKFTEQLLPQSASIEELQSSSRQLLPSLNELQEEELLLSKKKVQDEVNSVDEDDDDDCFNADSWELLDLVEKPEPKSLNSTVQDGDTFCKTSGILKSNNGSNGTCASSSPKSSVTDQTLSQLQRQKPKVSFQTPDLVKETQQIERITPKESNNPKLDAPGKRKSKCNKHGKQAFAADITANESGIDEVASAAVSHGTIHTGNAVGNLTGGPRASVCDIKAPKPVLNYAAALSMNPKKELLKKEDPPKESQTNATAGGSGVGSPQAIGALKRNRPVSSSSWSSNDEIESVDAIWDDIQKEKKEKMCMHNEKDVSCDSDSIVSSGFSDCDYGYEGLNDFVMRPKKVSIRRRTTSTSVGPKVKRASRVYPQFVKTGSGPCQDRAAKSCNMVDRQAEKSGQSKNIKPKKKKMIMSTPTNSVDFLKDSLKLEPAQTSSSSTKSSKTPAKLCSSSSTKTLAVQVSPVSQLMPPPLLPPVVAISTSSSFSGNDSSDIADMDESWYVTPPPCFTGSNKLQKSKAPRAKEAARENALIEHPSIYIASTSKELKPETRVVESKSSEVGSKLAKQKAIVLKKVTKQADTSNQKWKSTTVACKPTLNKQKVSWDNKFVVTNWHFDDQNDLDEDFENLFKSDLTIKKSSMKKRQKQQKVAPVKSQVRVDSDQDFGTLSPDLVDVSIEEEEEPSSDVLDIIETSISSEESTEPPIKVATKRNKPISDRKPPTQVRPIEPERCPGWQLKRQRSKRRPLASLANTSTGKLKVSSKKSNLEKAAGQAMEGDVLSSARSTPTLIDRIGSSIVANLSNLTSGFAASGALPTVQPRAVGIGHHERLGQSVVCKSNFENKLVARRFMSRSHLKRQNDCALQSGSNRRPDRRLKMHTNFNGYSIDRKVQTNFH